MVLDYQRAQLLTTMKEPSLSDYPLTKEGSEAFARDFKIWENSQKRNAARDKAAERLSSEGGGTDPRRRKNNMAEDAILGVVSGAGRTVQGIAGLAAEAAEYSKEEAAQPPDKSVQFVKPPTSIPDAFRAAWEVLNTPKAVGQKRLLEASRNMHRSIAGPMDKVSQVAEREYRDAKQDTDAIDAGLGGVGKAVSAVTEAGVGMINPVVGVGLGVGKERSIKGGVIPAAAQAMTRGNSFASKALSQAGEYAVQKAREELFRGKEDRLLAMRANKKKSPKKV
jgi:hypothetical protein